MDYVFCVLFGLEIGALIAVCVMLELMGYKAPKGYPRVPLDRGPQVRLQKQERRL